jgi:hypothetical protein
MPTPIMPPTITAIPNALPRIFFNSLFGAGLIRLFTNDKLL